MGIRMIRAFVALVLLLAAGCAPTRAPIADPAPLESGFAEIASRLDGHVGIAMIDLQTGAEASLNGDLPLPQQSVFKSWIALAAADAATAGALSWDERLRVGPADLGFPYQPIAAEVPPEGRDFTVAELVHWMVTLSDNPSADVLLRRLGGPIAVEDALARRGIGDVAVTTNERGLHAHADRLQAQIADLSPSAARAAVRAAMLTDPNAATALGVARGFAALAKSADGDRTLQVHFATRTGAARLKAGLPEGWRIAHKTGGGFDIAGLTTGANDAGVLVAPDGRRFAVAVLIAGSASPPAEQDAAIASVARLVAR